MYSVEYIYVNRQSDIMKGLNSLSTLQFSKFSKDFHCTNDYKFWTLISDVKWSPNLKQNDWKMLKD